MNIDDEKTFPFIVNGSVSDPEKENELKEIKPNEYAFLQSLRSSIKQDEAPTPGEFGWARLKRDIEKDQQGQQKQRNWWIPLSAAALLVIAIQTAFIVTPSTSDPNYQPLSGSNAELTLQIIFVDDAAINTINQTLSAYNATIIDGPDDIGMYVIQFESNAAKQTALKALGEIKWIEHVAEQ